MPFHDHCCDPCCNENPCCSNWDPWPPTCPEHCGFWPHDDLDYLAWENEFDDND